MKRDWSLQRQGYSLLFVVAVICVLGILSLSQTVFQQLHLLDSASSDNVQWTLSQAEVEYLELERKIDHSLATFTTDVDQVRLKFDIFYSRIATLESGSLYEGLRQTEDFTQSITNVRDYLDRNVDLIDHLQSGGRTSLLQLEAQTETVGTDVRRLATSGLYYFADLSDNRRETISVALQRLAMVTASLIAALALVAYYSHRVGKQAARGKLELQSAYTRMNTVVNASLDAVIVSDRNGRILDFNNAAEKIFGHRMKDVQGRKLGDIIVPEHLRAAHEAGIARHRQTGEKKVIGHGRIKLEAQRSNGEVFPVEMALESAGEGDHQIVIGFLRDISASVTAERELVEARDRALAGEKAKSDFLAVMTHEIRTPLNGIIGNLTLMRDTRLSNQQEKYAHNMAISARHLMQHVDRVLDIARFESGQFTMNEKATHLGRLIQDIVDAQGGFAEANGNTLQWSWIGPQMAWVNTDAARLQQILLNLVGNAIKFTKDGRISIEAEVMPSSNNPGMAEIEFRIIDTGVGIAETNLEKVFEDFQTIDTSFQRQANGTGLGLGIVRRLVQKMGGTVGAESAIGEGSVFWVKLPFKEASEPTMLTAPKNPYAAQKALQVLVVEDNEINLFLVREMLERLGHNVSVATDGLAGVQSANAKRFDLILMDISMPVLNGLEACRRIREGDGASNNSPIVALSANVLPEMRDRIVEAGMSGFLGKPFQQDELRALLASIDTQDPVPAKPKTEGPSEDILATLRKRFELETQELFDWLGQIPADHSDIAARCHKVAGSAAVFDNLELRNALLQVEMAAEKDTPDTELRSLIEKAKQVWTG